MIDQVVIGDYPALLQAMRDRVAELGITHETLDAIAGFQSGYSGKLLCNPPIKRLGPITLHMMIGALSWVQIFRHDEYAFQHMRHRYEQRVRPAVLAPASKILLTQDYLQRIGRMGGNARNDKLNPAKRSRIARRAAKARWRKPRVVEIKGGKAKRIREGVR